MKKYVFLCLYLCFGTANASLRLDLHTYNANELSFSISGTFDSDVTGDQKKWLAFKSDWSNNNGTNVDWISDSIGFRELDSVTGLTVLENTITFNGSSSARSLVSASGDNWGDSFYWSHSGNILAGTTVTGTLSVTGTNIFTPSVNGFELVSGFDNSDFSWNRAETSVSSVPVPAAVWLFSFGIIGLLGIRKKSVSLSRKYA